MRFKSKCNYCGCTLEGSTSCIHCTWSSDSEHDRWVNSRLIGFQRRGGI